MDNDKTIYNDPEKLKRTRENLANYFGGPGSQEPDLNDKVLGFLGMKDPVKEAMKRRQAAMQAGGYGK